MAAPGLAGAPAPRARRAPRRFSVVVTAVVLALVLGLAWLASVVNARNSERLLHQQVVQVATLLTTQLANGQIQMSDAGQVAIATGGQPGPFTRFADATLASPGISLSLWRVNGDQAAAAGPARTRAAAAAGRPGLLLLDPGADRRSSPIAGIVQDPEPRLAYALMPPGDTGLVVYAETPLNRRVSVEAGDAFGGLDLAAYLGRHAGRRPADPDDGAAADPRRHRDRPGALREHLLHARRRRRARG